MAHGSEPGGASGAGDEGVVIVGAGHAGGRCALGLRQAGYRGRITLLGDEAHWPYERPPLSKACLTSNQDIAQSCPALASVQQRSDLAIDHRPKMTAAQVDPASRTVRTADGQLLCYQHLVLATGSRPRPWSLNGVAASAVHQVHTRDDAERLRQALRHARRLLVVGGGFIGLEIAASARELGCCVVVIEPQERLLARAVSAAASDQLRQLHAARGVDLRLGRSILRASADPEGPVVVLDDGACVPYDLVVAGIGSLPRTELAATAGLELCLHTGGIVVDACGRTSDPHIYAVGDIASAVHGLYERRMRLESWDNAEVQAAAAAADIAARMQNQEVAPVSLRRPAVPWFWTDQHGLNLQILGVGHGAERTVLRGDPTTRAVLFHLQGERLVGAELFNSARERRLIKGWIQDAVALDSEVLRDERQALPRAARTTEAVLPPQEN